MAFAGEPLEEDVGLESPSGRETVGGIDDVVGTAVEDRDRDRERFDDIVEGVAIQRLEEPTVDPFAGLELYPPPSRSMVDRYSSNVSVVVTGARVATARTRSSVAAAWKAIFPPKLEPKRTYESGSKYSVTARRSASRASRVASTNVPSDSPQPRQSNRTALYPSLTARRHRPS